MIAKVGKAPPTPPQLFLFFDWRLNNSKSLSLRIWEPKKALTAPSALFRTLLRPQVLLLLPAHPDVTDFNFWRNESAAEADAAPERHFRKTQNVATINAAELPGLL